MSPADAQELAAVTAVLREVEGATRHPVNGPTFTIGPDDETCERDVDAAGLAERVLVRLRALAAPPETDRTLPTTREELAEFFGGIRLPGRGVGVTGVFVEHALALLADFDQPPASDAEPGTWAAYRDRYQRDQAEAMDRWRDEDRSEADRRYWLGVADGLGHLLPHVRGAARRESEAELGQPAALLPCSRDDCSHVYAMHDPDRCRGRLPGTSFAPCRCSGYLPAYADPQVHSAAASTGGEG